MNSKKKTWISIGVIGIVIFSLVFVIVSIANRDPSNVTNPDAVYSEKKALSELDKLYKQVEGIGIKDVNAPIDDEGIATLSLVNELPDISKYSPMVQGETHLNVEIISSTEKAGPGKDGWLNEVAEKFNNQKLQINGQTVSVTIRSISSGLATDYIISGKYVPDAFSPSNELWGEMLKSYNVKVNLRTSRLAGNVTGIVMKKDIRENFEKKFGEVNVANVIEACASGQLSMAYTNPFASSTGMNFIITALTSIDPNDPLSDTAKAGFQKFQASKPLMAYTTIQMREAVLKKGSQDALVNEYQNFYNTSELKGYEFIPYGIRHDNPVYSIGNLSDDKMELLNTFIQFCLNEENQKLASDYGFNNLDSYVSSVPKVTGDTIIAAQKLWKESKNVNTQLAAVFVADISGSMSGVPIVELKSSLLNSIQYINEQNMVGLVTYNRMVYRNLPLAKFDVAQQQLFSGAIKNLSPNGDTSTFSAVVVALKMLMEAKEANPDIVPMLFVLSDGETNSGITLNKTLINVIEGLGVPIYTIGYNANLDELSKLSSINEAASINAASDDVIYALKSLFNAQM